MTEEGSVLPTSASLLADARRATGLDDFGPPAFLEPLELFLTAARSTGQLNGTGRRVLPKVLVRHLANRLYLQDHLSRHGQVVADPPVVLIVTGLPRTGTTLLHNLLACDPANRVLRLWEALHPVPAGGRFSEEALVDQARTWLARLYELAPELRVVHGATAEGPEECDALLQNEFTSQHFEDMVQAEAYSRWLDHAPLSRQYASLALQLAVLDAGGDGRRWVLKSPSHLGHLDDVVQQFPSALVAHCHREPGEAVASHASLVAVVRRPYSDEVRGEVVGAHALRRGVVAMQRALVVREDQAPDRFVDVGYERLRRDPLGVVSTLYARIGRSLGEAAAEAMRGWLERNPQHRHGVHRYRLDDFGLDAQRVNDSFADYRRRFAEQLER